MASKCPNCGAPLKWYNFRAECKKCGVNIPNYNWEARLDEDADTAERAFAKLHYKLKNFKAGTVGSPLVIIRLIFTLLPLVALVVPLIKVFLSFPFYEKNQSVSFLTLITNYITKFDFFGGFKLMGAEVLGKPVTFLMFAVIAMFIAVACGVLNFFVVLLASLKLKAGFCVVLNTISTLAWAASSVLFIMFSNAAAATTVNVFSGSVIWWGYALGIGIFAANIIINAITNHSFKKKIAAQPTLEQAIENELLALREAETEEKIAL